MKTNEIKSRPITDDAIIDDFFPTRYLSSEDLLDAERQNVTVVIEKATIDELYSKHSKSHEEKLCIWFEGKRKGLVLNKTNTVALGDMFGNKVIDWYGKKIKIGVVELRAFGKKTTALRIQKIV